MRLGKNIATESPEAANSRSFPTMTVMGVLLITVLCVTNYLALYNEAFRLAIHGSGLGKSNSQDEGRSAAELAQVALVLGGDASNVAANVKNLLQKTREGAAENAVLQRDLSEARVLHQELFSRHQALEAKHLHLEKMKAELETRTKTATRRFSKDLSTRTTRGVARHLAGAAGEMVPVVGGTLVAAMLAWDVMDACELMKDLNAMNKSVGIEEEDVGAVCGVKIPDHTQLVAAVAKNWKAAYQSAASAVDKPPAVPNVSWSDLKSQVCVVTSVPGVCP